MTFGVVKNTSSVHPPCNLFTQEYFAFRFLPSTVFIVWVSASSLGIVAFSVWLSASTYLVLLIGCVGIEIFCHEAIFCKIVTSDLHPVGLHKNQAVYFEHKSRRSKEKLTCEQSDSIELDAKTLKGRS